MEKDVIYISFLERRGAKAALSSNVGLYEL